MTKKDTEKSIEVLKENTLLLAQKVDEVTNKLNEVIAVLQDNDLTRKIPVDYIYSEEETKEPEEEEAEDSEEEDEEEVEDTEEEDDEEDEDEEELGLDEDEEIVEEKPKTKN